MISFWEDYYQKNTIEAKRRPDGEVQFETGDPYIDKWERELAAGIVPDLMEGFDLSRRNRSKIAERDTEEAEREGIDPTVGFRDDYSKLVRSVER